MKIHSITNQTHILPLKLKAEAKQTKSINYTSVPYNVAYVTPFLGKPQYTQNERNFMKFRDEFGEKMHQAAVEDGTTDWDFDTNSTEENRQKADEAGENYMKLFDEETYAKLNEFGEKGISDKALIRQHKSLTDTCKDYVEGGDEIMALQGKESSIAQKYNEYRCEINGEKVPNYEVGKILQKSKDVDLRKQAYQTKSAGGDLIADDLVDLVKMRNEYAKTKGYDNYFSYKLKEDFDVDEKQLYKLLDDLTERTDKVYTKIAKERDLRLSKEFNVSPDKLQPWHYGLEEENSPTVEADKYVLDKETPEQVSLNLYKNMGWDINKMPITLDLFPRENKNQHGFCFGVDTNKDSRILANLTDDTNSIDTLNHELGHCVYNCGLPDGVPFVDQQVASSAMTEAVAMLMGTILVREGNLAKALDMPKELGDSLEKDRCKGLINFTRKYASYVEFERELYKNPDQNVGKLWHETDAKYMKKPMPEKTDNNWATVPHFLSHPAYMQNYLRAEIMAAQIHDAASQKLGKISENPKTAEFFKNNIFKHGATLDENEVIEYVTGKDLSAEPFCKQFETL